MTDSDRKRPRRTSQGSLLDYIPVRTSTADMEGGGAADRLRADGWIPIPPAARAGPRLSIGPVPPAPSAGSPGWQDDASRPLLEPVIMLRALWRYRRHIVLATILGAAAGVAFALSTPREYYAENRLFIDPREVRVTEDDARNQLMSTEAMIAIADSQVQILSSSSVLERVISELGLERDPEFNGSASGGLSGGIALIRELVSGKGRASDASQQALEKLGGSLNVSRDAKTFVINIGVKTREPKKSALIANRIVETYLDTESRAQSGLLESTSKSINERISALRADLDVAEREVERYKAENDIVGVAGEIIGDKPILALNDQLAAVRAQKIGIKVKAENLAKADLDAVVSGAFPEQFLSPTLAELRKQYAQTRTAADSLSTKLGPRHPQYISASSSLEAIRGEIRSELRRIVASSQVELQRAIETEQDLASQLAVAKVQSLDKSVEYVQLRELERKANTTREIYEAFLKRARETSERGSLSTRSARVISVAEPPLDPLGPSRKLIVMIGAIGGMIAAAGLALMAGAAESIRNYGTGAVQPWSSHARPGPDAEIESAGVPDRRTPSNTTQSCEPWPESHQGRHPSGTHFEESAFPPGGLAVRSVTKRSMPAVSANENATLHEIRREMRRLRDRIVASSVRYRA